MRNLIRTAFAFILSAMPLIAGAAAPADANMTFRDIEFDYPRGEREVAGRTMLETAIPIGSSVVTARTILRDRGAHCRPLSPDGVLRCSFSAFDTIEDHLQDVAWRIIVASDDGKVRELNVHRSSRGS